MHDSQHAGPPGHGQQNGFGGVEKAAYIPPHMRNAPRGAPPPGGPNGFDGPPPVSNGLDSSAWAPPPGQK